MRTMVVEYLPTFARTKSPSHVSKYTMWGPQDSVQLVNITPITIVDGTYCITSYNIL